MNDPVFYNKDGSLTRYSLACGYVEKEANKENWKEMYMEHSHLHVRAGVIGQKWSIWDVFEYDELTKARKRYRSIKINQPIWKSIR